MSRTMKRLRTQESWAGPGATGATARSWLRGGAMAVLLTFMVPSQGSAASDWVLQALLAEDAATVEEALPELSDALYGPFDSGPWSVESVGALFREDVNLAAWFGEVLAKGRPEARDAVSQAFLLAWGPLFIPEWIEFAAENHRSAKEIYEGWPDRGDGDWVPTMEGLRSREDGGGLLAELSDSVPDDEARRLALVFAGQMRRVWAALPRLLEEEYDRRRRSGTIGSRPPSGSGEVLEVLLQALAYYQERWGTEETRAAAWAKWMKDREARGLPTEVVGVEAPWNLYGMSIAHRQLGESDIPVEGRELPPEVRRVALALTAEPRTELRHDERLEAAVSLLANERPLAEETGRRIFDLYCGSLDGACFEKLNLLYAGPDDPSLRSIEADVGGRVVESLAGLVEEKERHCGALVECDGAECPAVIRVVSETDWPEEHGTPPERSSRMGNETWTRMRGLKGADGEDQFRVTVPARERIGSIGEELQEALALVGRLEDVPRPVLDGVFEFWSTERFPEARRILEENDWLGPDVGAVTSAQREERGTGPAPRRRIGVAELCEGSM